MNFWTAFFARLLSAQTARFVLALLSLSAASFGAYQLMTGTQPEGGNEAAIFAVGQLFALATMAFGYYYGSTARNDDRPQDVVVQNASDNPVPVEEPKL